MSLNALQSHGTKLYIGDGLGGYTLISEVLDVDGLSEKINFHDASSQEDSAESVVPSSLKRFDMLNWKINWIPTDPTHQALLTAMRARTLTYLREEYVDGTTEDFAGYVANFKRNAPVDGILTGDLSFKLTTDVTTTY